MQNESKARCSVPLALAIAAVSSGMLRAQSLPPAQPTAPVTGAPAAAQIPPPASHAQVRFAAGVLSIEAENASLNEILNEIARKTGMIITGGVQDERVYGDYGPADVGSVLNNLLEGTGSNMLLLASLADRPQELILTPRNGGPTPPSPTSAMYNRHDQPEPFARPHPHMLPGAQAAQTGTMQPAAVPTTPVPMPAAGTTTQTAPNGVKTPQQIYEELLQLQQKNAANGSTTPK